jgi:hypothetical protein
MPSVGADAHDRPPYRAFSQPETESLTSGASPASSPSAVPSFPEDAQH